MSKNNNKKSKKIINKKLIEKHKKEIIIATLITITVLVGVIGTTYAMFIAKGESDVQEMYKVGDLSVAFENTGSAINMRDEYPMTDEAGLKTTPHTFTITNNGDYNVTYTIQIENKNTSLNPTHIKYAINASTPTLLSTETTSIDIGTLTPKEKKTFELRLWIDENTGETQANKTYEGQIKVNGQAVRIPYFKDTSGANKPEIENTGLIPVVYDGVNDEWMVADKEKGWYAYQDQIWANAVTVSDTAIEYRSAKAGTVIPMDAINSMWVWIPRYKYQIPSDIGSTKTVSNPSQIDVVFEKDTETTGLYNDIGASGYYTHPAFRNGNSVELLTKEQKDSGGHTGWDTELTGFWVGKFETGGTTSAPLIKPDIQSLRGQTVSNLFKTSLVFAGGTMDSNTGEVTFSGNETYGLSNTVDTHMMKNTEWGAVAYLSQSKYGKNGNNNYVDANKEIYKNDSSGYYTGRSCGTPPASGNNTNGTYSYNGKSCSTINSTTNECTGTKDILKGTGASTTGTIYGVYDMSGGAYEYVMGNWKETTGSSEFTTFPEQKYWDKYTGTNDSDSITKEKAIKGDATYETMRWYSNYPFFVKSDNAWFRAGGDFTNDSIAGIFRTITDYGQGHYIDGFRNVLIP